MTEQLTLFTLSINFMISLLLSLLFSIPFPAFFVCGLLDKGHSDWCEVISHCSSDLHFSNNDGETVETVSDFILGGSKITADGDCSHEIKRRLLL